MQYDADVMRLAPYLFQQLFDLGAAHAFGIPGDHVLPLYEALGASPIRSILTTHEPSAGFAADAYARIQGIGVAIGTYGAGVLNMVNPIAQAYAEKSPVMVISGAPDKVGRDPGLLIHHKVKTFDTSLHPERSSRSRSSRACRMFLTARVRAGSTTSSRH